MALTYDHFMALSTPPRAGSKAKIPTLLLPAFERKGWWAQAKKSGSYCVTYVDPAGDYQARDRRGDTLATWHPTPGMGRVVKRLPRGKWHVVASEWLATRAGGTTKPTHFIHDILVFGGSYTTDMTYAERYEFLEIMLRPVPATEFHSVLDEDVWLARNVKSDFKGAFARLPAVDEGLVLKDPKACWSLRPDGAWTVKCRKSHARSGEF